MTGARQSLIRPFFSTALGKVDDEHYRALVIEKAHLPAPENQSGSKRLIVESMASVGINTDVTGIVYAPAPGRHPTGVRNGPLCGASHGGRPDELQEGVG